MSIQSELEALKDKEGLIVPERAVEWARDNKTSDLHRELEWDDEAAGHQYRIWQVRRLIALHIVNATGERQAFSLSIDRVKPGGGYRDIDDILASKKMHDILLEDALKELDRIQAKYDRLTALRPIWQARDIVRKKSKAQSAARDRKRRRRGGGEHRPAA